METTIETSLLAGLAQWLHGGIAALTGSTLLADLALILIGIAALLGVNGLMPVQETNDEVTVSALVDCMATTNDVNVRSTPSTSSTILVTLPQNSPVAVTGKTEGWYQVLFNDQLAYMSADYLRAVSE